ncbi:MULTISPECIES: PEP/pyruvate-binding domain-containing protein [Mesonia]|uniref:Prodigiosin synthesizing transferase PigC n=1 Tax=Mesonia oceanica TaxID=2687242 RepID=A0AC61Y468_9FLAO|nr:MULTISPECIES: PEP/pyruvate-binding domain-containing protein [Mesonia]MAN28048.1 phosphoenolpyruvate synthase [Mesonia sp.]MAQ42421.1 phosphoenolpyruvate synthase [Mesonia sp.]MBJ96727.1 phosphoenolpyruvate synthase [Flavobacteriaceae bacterium]VVU99293.1 Prodigiosin synthesizing transferase PigC [Mesonia oceanica]|tara:strand:+ start:10897 stop:13803 length:2907 start_codon:yes stop_codon:yes gene_type:complete
MKFRILLVLSIFFFGSISAQEISNERIKEIIEEYRNLHRGPYLKIEWFCDDGTQRDSKDPCPDKIGGIQHASYKPITIQLQEKNHIFFADILAYTDKGAFWDANHQHSRLKQYQLNNYLESVDNGWIMEKAQYYRGSVQSEDEQEWGKDFYNWLLLSNNRIEENFYLIRQSLQDIPHNEDTKESQTIRSLSKTIAEDNPKFMDARTKIHGQPDKTDIQLVKKFKEENEKDLSAEQKKEIDSLTRAMENFYSPIDLSYFKQEASNFPKGTFLRTQLENFGSQSQDSISNQHLIESAANLMCEIRTELPQVQSTSDQLIALDLSVKLEEIIFKTAPEWKPSSLLEQLDKIYALSLASASAGNVEWWEWNQVDHLLQLDNLNEITLEELNQILAVARSQVEWSAAMVKAIYGDAVEKYNAFEPKASGFIDDRVRSSLALRLGETVSELGNFIREQSKLSNEVFKLNNQSSFRGLNPGYALGKLIVVEDNPESVEVSPENIYIFQKPPSDLKPVAGIATVSEGNLVSHVQLLARNLGIPNSVLSNQNLEDLKKFDGEMVFYAVSEKGMVIMKAEDEMSSEEKALFKEEGERQQEKISVPIERINLQQTSPLNLTEVDAKSSGIICGPKAANLGQLKSMFPNNVVNGVVVPFGIFREHMNLPMPQQDASYWEYLKASFAQAQQMRENNIPETEVQHCTLDRLALLREAIKKMPLVPNFVNDLERSFQTNFGTSIGGVPVFLRSDTNMEDLGNFTGAGLNLTVFNVRDREKIIQGIKDVWASPYTERSFKWRQQYLENPENVFPSILIIPSVDVDYSGVMITKGIINNNPNDLTVAFSRGAGGAVDGQSAEAWLIDLNGEDRLLSPARETFYNRLPQNGGLDKESTSFNHAILSSANIKQLEDFAQNIRKTMPEKTSKENVGPYDVELGFKDNKLWLFQIRPFVENKNAQSSKYLQSLTPEIDTQQKISLQHQI